MEVPITQEPCPSCGFIFWVPTSFNAKRREDHKSFYCPSCRNNMYYSEETAAEKCAKEAERLARKAELLQRALDATERSRISQKGATTKLRKKLQEVS